jgi:aquaporin Z
MLPCVAEYIGTLLIVGTYAFSGNVAYLVAAFAVVQALIGKISGGHTNPAVSLWAWGAGKLPTATLGMYVAAQVGAALTVVMLQSVA